MSEPHLLSLLSKGDSTAFRAIYEQYWPELYKAAYRRLADAQLAEDVVQEVFFRLWRGRNHLQIAQLSPYLHRAIRNEVFERLSRSTAPSRFYELFETVLLETDTPEAILRSKDLLALVAAYTATLPARKREIFLLHIESRLNTREIAEKLQISQKTVQNQLAAAMNGLREQLGPLLLAVLASRL